jgi:hypothetical protein
VGGLGLEPHAQLRGDVASSLAFERPPSFGLRLKMRLHHLICVWCQRYQKQLQFLQRAAPKMQEEIEAASNRALSEESKRRMVERLRKECRDRSVFSSSVRRGQAQRPRTNGLEPPRPS